MSAHRFLIRRTTADDWREVRDLRLEMIRDTPQAYVESLEQAETVSEAEWRARGARGTAEHGISLAGIDASGRWVATMGGFVPDAQQAASLDVGPGPLLVGVYVAPDVRGREVGLADAMLTAVEDWARHEGDQFTLHVHEDNPRAQAFYARRGFVATGRTVPYPLVPEEREVEMVKDLRPAGGGGDAR
ncbi:GNAT family N-acetyltransferase [Sanguibacter keddieii]|uniref:GNAT family N-acetyltransferase n=1 Tax=Sanguibacter keddieii TaxID=60920 RepID=UPI001FE0F778|nr:GNAT family N-acetyltransferase [Sanguibacter keddieii]